jgi:ferrous iron transport protein B
MVLELKTLGVPMLLVLNMIDQAEDRGLRIDIDRLSRELGIPVVTSVAVRSGGTDALLKALDDSGWAQLPRDKAGAPSHSVASIESLSVEETHQRVLALLSACVSQVQGRGDAPGHTLTDRVDRFVLHPVFGPLILAALMFLVFQAVFSWASVPMDLIDAGTAALGEFVGGLMSEGMLRSLLVDGVIAGAGSAVIFLPQIIILFAFILVLEESGYLPRAAFLLDRVMGGVGLSGRAFIPLLSSFACAIPGIMATRTMGQPRDRLITILIAPLMTCSARLPVYALLIAAFIPDQTVWGLFNLQGLVLFTLYMAGIVAGLVVAFVLKRIMGQTSDQPLLMALPDYHWPHLRNIALGLWERAMIFLKRVGTIILALMIVLWFLSTFPGAPEGATQPAIDYSYAGQLGKALEVVLSPIGFNWQICIALVPAMAAREVVVSALGTVYALSQTGEALDGALGAVIHQQWSLATALSLLTWFVFAPHCLATLSVVKRETNGWKIPLVMAAYLFGLAYACSWVVYRLTLHFTG